VASRTTFLGFEFALPLTTPFTYTPSTTKAFIPKLVLTSLFLVGIKRFV